MCGIAGVIASTPHDIDADATAMAESLAHRGPDDHGQWSDKHANVH
jgi:asparagine synthetase B (glutamine-hydrolysing)